MSKELDIIDSDAFDHIKAVADLYVRGVTSHFTIARRLGIKAVEAKAAIQQWQMIIREDSDSRDLARDHLDVMIKRYDSLLEELNDNLDRLKSLGFDEKISAQINTTVKNIGDLDKARVDLLQRAGLLDASDLGDELAEREERERFIIEILKNDLCPDCQARALKKINTLMQGGIPHG